VKFFIADSFTQRHPRAARRIILVSRYQGQMMPLIAILLAKDLGATVALSLALGSAWLFNLGYQVANADRDSLTGLPTRRTTERILRRADRRAVRMTIAIGDADGLHALNGNLGHAAGDRYLTAVADRLLRAVPKGGLLVRLGGDEYAILAPNTDAAELATAIEAAMAGPLRISGYHIQPRISVGIATGNGHDANITMARADAAMYSAKAAGGNHSLVYDEHRDGPATPYVTRPLVRRRDINVTAGTITWTSTAPDELVPLLVTPADAHTIYHALRIAADSGSRSLTNAASTEPGGPPTPDRYQRLAARYRPLIDGTHPYSPS
jgi:diguanylate cyclase (GGDEF)-like protein